MKGPNFDIAFSVGNFHIYWYAILLAAGIAAAVLISDRRAKGREMPKDIALDLCILGVPFGVLGGRLFACLSGMVAWKDFFDLTHPGLSFFGSIAFAAAAILVYVRLRKASVGEMLDIAAPGVFAGIGIAVWGDFFNRANYGPLVQKASHKWFPLATFGKDLQIHYAAFFYEFLLCLVLIAVYYVLLRKVIRRKADRFLIMAVAYCLGRFCIDGIRQDLVMMGPLAFDQVCEIVLAVLCLLLLFLKKRPKEAEKETIEQPEPTETGEAAETEEKEETADKTPAPDAEQKDDFSGLR